MSVVIVGVYLFIFFLFSRYKSCKLSVCNDNVRASSLSFSRTHVVPLKPAGLNGERAGKKTGLSAGGSTLTAVGRLPAARVHRVCFLHSKRARAREAIFIGPLSQTHLSLSRRNVRRWHMAGSDIKGFICCCGASLQARGPVLLTCRETSSQPPIVTAD